MDINANSAIGRLRARLLGGYGPGAGEAVIASMTRDRPVIAGQPTVVGLERQARQAEAARSAGPGLLQRLLRRGRGVLAVAGAGLVVVYALARINQARIDHHDGRRRR